jgi:hypothetical protein
MLHNCSCRMRGFFPFDIPWETPILKHTFSKYHLMAFVLIMKLRVDQKSFMD